MLGVIEKKNVKNEISDMHINADIKFFLHTFLG